MNSRLRLDVRAPRAYYAAVDDVAQQAIIVMDDVVAKGGRFLSAHTPYSLDRTRDTLGQLARLHASTWGCDDVADFDWLSPRIVGMADIFPSDLLQSLLDDGRGPDVAPELRVAENVAEAMRRTGAHEVTCVIHADPHSGNSYLDAEGRACWLDWQIVQRGNWATDISYHLATVLDIEARRGARGRAAPPLPARARVARRSRADVGGRVGAVHAELLLRLLPVGDHADQLAGGRAGPHPASRDGAHRPRHLPSSRCRLSCRVR